MKKPAGKLILLIVLALLSAALYTAHYIIFRDSHHIFLYLLGDIAFLPLEILFVSMIFHKSLEEREKKNTLKKLNMVIGVFYSQIGIPLLRVFIKNDPGLGELGSRLRFNTGWGNKEFRNALSLIEKHTFSACMPDPGELKVLLSENRDFMMKTIENPILLEHEMFSELMMAVFHLGEELSGRCDVSNLCSSDRDHINIDISRACKALLKQWILYIRHLKDEYPYLFSFAVRTNPFDENAKVEIGG